MRTTNQHDKRDMFIASCNPSFVVSLDMIRDTGGRMSFIPDFCTGNPILQKNFHSYVSSVIHLTGGGLSSYEEDGICYVER